VNVGDGPDREGRECGLFERIHCWVCVGGEQNESAGVEAEEEREAMDDEEEEAKGEDDDHDDDGDDENDDVGEVIFLTWNACCSPFVAILLFP